MYLGSTMALGTLSVCLTVVVLNIHHRGRQTPVPDWVRKVFLCHVANVLGLSSAARASRANPNLNRRLASKPNNYKRRDDGESAEMIEIQHILAPNDTRPGHGQHVVTDNMLLAEAMQYHKVDIPYHKIEGQSQNNPPASCSAAGSAAGRASKDEVNQHRRQEENAKEWQLLARVFDRLFFCVVFLTMLCCAVFILMSPWYDDTPSVTDTAGFTPHVER